MNIYIAYKFSNVKDKQALKNELLQVSDMLEGFGHSTFILGRDVQNWDNTTHSVQSKIKKMTDELKASEGMFVYINSDAFSWGLVFEMHMAKLMGKKIILAIKDGYKAPYFKLLASEAYHFKSFKDLQNDLSDK